MKNKYKNIMFTDTMFTISDGYFPEPASKNIPKWYKETESYVNGKRIVEDAKIPMTIKRCLPFFDAMTAGYYLFTHCDIYVSQVDGKPYYQWAKNPAIEFHNRVQADKYPLAKETDYPKFINRWSIKTPLGYSSLFINPMHNPSKIFTILEGVVDTDKYIAPVNFPFILNDNTWEGMIPAGTPIAQVIPFKRDKFKMIIGGEKEAKESDKLLYRLKSVFDNGYRNFWRSEKKYL
jgi:hypothetical protein